LISAPVMTAGAAWDGLVSGRAACADVDDAADDDVAEDAEADPEIDAAAGATKPTATVRASAPNAPIRFALLLDRGMGDAPDIAKCPLEMELRRPGERPV
jgi:hypothetical protein